MTADEVRTAYLTFFKERGHRILPSSSLVPQNDPTTLFTSSGMQPMMPYLLGAKHPEGVRLADSQKCFRSQDIEEVGDNRHTTSFEMLGNWSLGDYFKSEQIAWYFEFLTTILKLPKEKLYVTVFGGDQQFDKDTETVEIWKSLGILDDHIFPYDAKKNWWSRAGTPDEMPVGEPGGPDSEVFFEFVQVAHDKKYGEKCHPNCDCGRFLEIGNSVFMTYLKTETGFVPLKEKNIDFGGGLERTLAAVNDNPDVFKTDLFAKPIAVIEDVTKSKYDDNKQAFRVISDHMKASVFLITDGVLPSNKLQGYFLRRLLRRLMIKMQELKGHIDTPVKDDTYLKIADSIFGTYKQSPYFENVDKNMVFKVIANERDKFGKTLELGLKKIDEVSPFDLYQTYGFPIEVTEELYKNRGKIIDRQDFETQLKNHQDLSRTSSAGMFKGGLADHSEQVTKYHTATHLLQAALRQVLGDHVHQEGSNITGERLRFDFSHPQKLSDIEIEKVEVLN